MIFRPKIIFFAFFILSMGYIVSGQNYFNSNLINNLIFSNPAYAVKNNYSIVQLNYRNQWPVANMFTTFGGAYFHSLDNLNSNIGFIITQDRQYKGAIVNTGLAFNYGYKLDFNNKNYLLFGLLGGYSSNKLDYTQLTFENPLSNPTEELRNNYPWFNVGISYILYDQHVWGVSVLNLGASNGNPAIEPQFNLFYSGFIENKSYNSIVSFYEPVVSIDFYPGFFNISYGGNLGLYNFKTGFLLKQNGIKLSTLDILLGISFDNYEFVYTYDLNLSGAASINPKMAAHEVTFLRKIQYKGRRTKRRAIKCPKI